MHHDYGSSPLVQFHQASWGPMIQRHVERRIETAFLCFISYASKNLFPGLEHMRNLFLALSGTVA